jgi:hypothetical protein
MQDLIQKLGTQIWKKINDEMVDALQSDKPNISQSYGTCFIGLASIMLIIYLKE